jgi:DNA-directed RNA polymerase subunit RPC12/RpoP
MNPHKTSRNLDDVQESLRPHQVRFVNEHASCAMCDSRLEIRHEINTKELKVKEEAHCPSCGIRVRSTHHLMH